MQELARLSERLSKINEALQRKVQARNEFDQTIMETEAAYMKVCDGPAPRSRHKPSWRARYHKRAVTLYMQWTGCWVLLCCGCVAACAHGDVNGWSDCPHRAQILESSQTLLTVLKRESVGLVKKKQTSS